MPSNILVSGLTNENEQYNGLYVYSSEKTWILGDNEGSITLFTSDTIGEWVLEGVENSGTISLGTEAWDFPWLASWAQATLTEVPSQPTFGLPAETVALITSRFGTVANYLRLRNQGQV